MTKLLLYDVETMGERGWYWPPRYDTNILHVDHFEHLLSVAWKWGDEKRVHVKGLDDFKGYAKNRHDDKELVRFIGGLFTEADLIIAHNGDSFDQKMVNARIITHHLSPPKPYKQIDTRKVAKKYARFASNKLDDLCKQMEGHGKIETGGFATWLGCDAGDKAAWSKMKRYNKVDVQRLEEIYLGLRPWIGNHPHSFPDKPKACPRCGSDNLQARGWRYNTATRTRQYHCQNCWGWCRGTEYERIEKKLVAI